MISYSEVIFLGILPPELIFFLKKSKNKLVNLFSTDLCIIVKHLKQSKLYVGS